MHTDLKLQDLIDENIAKSKAILNCLLTTFDNQNEPDRETIYQNIWAAHDCLKEITEFVRGDLTTKEELQ